MKKTYEELKKDLDDYFGDTSRSQEETIEDLETLIEEINMMIESLKPHISEIHFG